MTVSFFMCSPDELLRFCKLFTEPYSVSEVFLYVPAIIQYRVRGQHMLAPSSIAILDLSTLNIAVEEKCHWL